jgi:hypothetical protein
VRVDAADNSSSDFGDPSRRRAQAGEPGEPAPRRRRTFTDLLRRLSSEPADEKTFAELWQTLRSVLVAELKRRGLWESSPSYLGVYGAPLWWAEATAGGGGALEDLVADCYAFIFIDRLRALRAQLAVKPNVDGLVFTNVRHFLHDRQKEHDRLGFLVFDALRTAVRAAVEAGELSILEGDPRIRNDTVLGFAGGSGPTEPAEVDLPALVRRWNDDLLPDLVTAHGRGRQPVHGRLRRCLQELRRQGLEAIRFKDLVDPMKSDVRARWAALLVRDDVEVAAEDADREAAGVAAIFRPDLCLEARDAFRVLVECISELVARFEDGETLRRHLDTLWQFLRTWAVGGEGSEGRLPSQRKLAALLGIPRDRLPELFGLVRRIAERCQAESSRGGGIQNRGGVHSPHSEGKPE